MDQKKINKYYEKYKKYCEKQKNLIGGVIPIMRHKNRDFMIGWKQIGNIGKMNCGIFLNPSFPSSIMKCEFEELNPAKEMYNKKLGYAKIMYNRANDINELAIGHRLSKIYAKIESFHEYKGGEDRLYIIMEKMDGTIGNLITEVIPKLCIDFIDHRYTKKQKIKLLKIFNFKLNSLEYTQKDIDKYQTNKGDIFHKINILKKLLRGENIKKIYEKFLVKIINLLNIVYPIILKKIDRLVMNMYQLNYIQYDNHMGNIGYRIHLSEGEKLFEQNIYDPNIWKNQLEILFIDPAPHTFLESGPDIDGIKMMRSLLFDINNLSPSDYRCDILYYMKQNKIFTSKYKNKNEESHITNILYNVLDDSVFFLQKNYDFIFISETSHENIESYFLDEQPKYKIIMV
jgi:hypothetical protein